MKKYFILFVLSVGIYFAHSIITYQGLYGDGNGYYVYTQSILYDHKLNSQKVYDYLSNFPGPKYTFSRIFWNPEQNPFTIGTGLVWLPATVLLSLFSSNRFDILLELGCGLTGIILMISGLYFLEKYLLNFYTKGVALWTMLTIFFATNVFYYSAFEPALSHQPSFFLICFLLNFTYKFKKSKLKMFAIGCLSGLLLIIRPIDSLLLIPIFLQAKMKISDFIFVIPGALLTALPQILNQYFQYGNPLINLYLTGANGTWQFSFYHLLEYMFSPKRGLFLWSPVLLLGFWGLIKSRAIEFTFTIILFWIITSSWSAYLSAGFGQRLSFSAIPFFAYGLAYIFKKLSLNLIVLLFLIFSAWNLILLKNVYLHKNLFIQSNTFNYVQFFKYMATFG